MVGVAPDGGSGRRLPQWMLGISAPGQVVNSDNVEVNKKHSVEELMSHDRHSDPSTTRIHPGKESLRPEKEKLFETSDVLAKCKTSRRKLKVKQKDAESENKISAKVPAKKNIKTKKESLECASQKRQKTKDFDFKSSEEVEIRPLSEDEDVELTMEDLMTIAEEYVRTDKNTDQDQAAKRTSEPRFRPPATLSPRKESKDCNDAHSATDDTSASYCQSSSTHNISASHKLNSSTETIAITTRATGDPAQDMLDLFLGPWLRKPVEEKKTDSVVEDAAFSQDFGIQSKKEIAPSVKKKSSLKDKLAMFLD
ncbi:hypothetical protein L484_014952 [Morus notabilis]|uniref:Uncharacterized protein n=1 Tax=Morus notabilis TaxID=981085 RepID=W9SAE0_9ROSA|nr:uncharacterized protein LOC21398068 [Morus notabilis]EXC33073.1 hypothetical protein L484_014952 [Morus notabilis]